ncbi:MAG: hypothetical protein KUG81_09915 [Gammaproteobacteria bacterium]|nr:hypothetical protein [Gammaproteobacteria bacterium]
MNNNGTDKQGSPAEVEASAVNVLVNCPTAEQLIEEVKHHPRGHGCPVCGEDCGPVAMVYLVYTFEPCDCDQANYVHLVEAVYHRQCFLGRFGS